MWYCMKRLFRSTKCNFRDGGFVMKVLAYQVRPDEKQYVKTLAPIYGHDVIMVSEDFSPDTAYLAEGYEGLMIQGNSKANRKALETISLLGIKYITSRAAGTNNIDVAACSKLGIKAAHVPAYSPNAVSEFTVGLILTLTRRIHAAIKKAERKDFSLRGLIGTEIRNCVLGVIGAGRIGFNVIKAFSGFGCRIIVHDIFENEEVKKYATFTTLEELYSEADIITLHCPLFEENYHMINDETISKMKDGVIIVNAARGALIDSKALIRGIKSGKIGAVALDVYEEEVGVFHNDHSDRILQDDILPRLLQFPNVIVTPHCAFYTDEAVSNMVETALSNLKNYELSGTCKNEIK